MNKRSLLLLGCGALCLSASLASCKESAPTPVAPQGSGASTPGQPTGFTEAQRQALRLLNELPEPSQAEREGLTYRLQNIAAPLPEGEGEPIEIGNGTEEKTPGTFEGLPGSWITKTRTYRLTQAFDESLLLNPTGDIAYPGCVLRGSSIATGEYAHVSGVETEPTTISISRTPTDPSVAVSKQIPQIRMSSYREQLAYWQRQTFQPEASSVMYSLDVVNNTKDITASLGASVGHDIFNLKTNFSFSRSTAKNHIFGKFLQRTYSVTMDAPLGPTIFNGFNTDLASLLGGVRPVYVSNINYGRIVFVLIETDQDLTSVQAAIDFMLKKNEGANLPVDLSVNAEANYKKVFETSKLRLCTLGGSNGQQAKLTEGTLENLKGFIQEEVSMSSLVPVSIQLRYAHDNSLARIVTQLTYPVTEKIFVPEFESVSFEIAPTGFVLKGDIDKTNEIFGKARVDFAGKTILPEIFHIPSWIRFRADGVTKEPYGGQGAKTVTLTRGAEETVDQFLARRVEFVTELQEKQPAHTFPYGTARFSLTVADIIAKAQSSDPEFAVNAQYKTYMAKTFFKLSNARYIHQGKPTTARGFSREVH